MMHRTFVRSVQGVYPVLARLRDVVASAAAETTSAGTASTTTSETYWTNVREAADVCARMRESDCFLSIVTAAESKFPLHTAPREAITELLKAAKFADVESTAPMQLLKRELAPVLAISEGVGPLSLRHPVSTGATLQRLLETYLSAPSSYLEVDVFLDAMLNAPSPLAPSFAADTCETLHSRGLLSVHWEKVLDLLERYVVSSSVCVFEAFTAKSVTPIIVMCSQLDEDVRGKAVNRLMRILVKTWSPSLCRKFGASSLATGTGGVSVVEALREAAALCPIPEEDSEEATEAREVRAFVLLMAVLVEEPASFLQELKRLRTDETLLDSPMVLTLLLQYLLSEGMKEKASEELKVFVRDFPRASEKNSDFFHDAHRLVLQALCDEEDIDSYSAAYLIVVLHKYHGLKVDASIVNILARRFAPLGDPRVFNLVDLCTLFCGNRINMETIRHMFVTCEVVGDHHRAKTLFELFSDESPGFASKLEPESIKALRNLKILPGNEAHLFSPGNVSAVVPSLRKGVAQ